MEKRSTIIKYSVATGIGLVFVVTYILLKDVFHAESPQDVFKILTDGFFIPSILLLGVGAISFVNKEGLFDGIGYAFSTVFVIKNWSSRRFKDRESYSQYKERKAEKRTTLTFLIHVGLAFFAVSMICLVIFNLL